MDALRVSKADRQFFEEKIFEIVKTLYMAGMERAYNEKARQEQQGKIGWLKMPVVDTRRVVDLVSGVRLKRVLAGKQVAMTKDELAIRKRIVRNTLNRLVVQGRLEVYRATGPLLWKGLGGGQGGALRMLKCYRPKNVLSAIADVRDE